MYFQIIRHHRNLPLVSHLQHRLPSRDSKSNLSCFCSWRKAVSNESYHEGQSRSPGLGLSVKAMENWAKLSISPPNLQVQWFLPLGKDEAKHGWRHEGYYSASPRHPEAWTQALLCLKAMEECSTATRGKCSISLYVARIHFNCLFSVVVLFILLKKKSQFLNRIIVIIKSAKVQNGMGGEVFQDCG